MAKKESTFLNMTLTLSLVALISSTALGFVYEMTKEPIAEAIKQKTIDAIKEVVPPFTNDPSKDSYTRQTKAGTLVFYPAKNDGKLVGTAVETLSNIGFGGTMRLMVGLLPDGTINNIVVISHQETPGLGDKIEKKKSSFSLQFDDKNPKTFKLAIKKDGGDVDGITAATYSSRAFCDAVQRAYTTFEEK